MAHGQSRPEDFLRRVLVCTLGRTPQLITETVYALAHAQPAFVPTEIRLVTTAAGRETAMTHLVGDESRLTQLYLDYALPPPQFDAGCIHVIDGADGASLDDIRTPAQSDAAADAIFRLLRELAHDPAAALHVSLAGGRKTMGFLLGHALCLCGRAQDRLSHVLVNEPFESLPEFFYPPPEPAVLTTPSGTAVSTADAIVELVDIPFVHMGTGLPQRQLADAATFGMAVALATAALRPPLLEIDEACGTVRCGGRRIELEPQPFAVYAWLADRCIRYGLAGAVAPDDLRRRASPALSDFLRWLARYGGMHPYADLAGKFRRDDDGAVAQWFRERVSRINAAIRQELGQPGVSRYGIQFTSTSRSTRRRHLNLAPENIRYVSLAAEPPASPG